MSFKSQIKDVRNNMRMVGDFLKVKGGDEINFIIKSGDFIARVTDSELRQVANRDSGDKYLDFDNLISAADALVEMKCKNIHSSSYVQVVGFSRLTPEMEETSKSLSQPYHNIQDNTVVVVHGTIPNAEKIAKRNNISIEVDTELFNYLPFDYVCRQVEKEGGKISAMMLYSDSNGNGKVKYYHNGLGLYQYNYTFNIMGEKINVNYDTNINMDFLFQQNVIRTKTYPINHEHTRPRIIALFSGGLDITCATQKAISDLEEIQNDAAHINLWYFDWGTNARKGEIKAGKKFLEIYNDRYDITHDVIKVKKMFKNVLSGCNMTSTRLLDKEAKGAGSHEAEAAISYVPYRNTFLMTLAVARAEQLYPGETIQFVIGANLSEGMVYLDNSETWLTHMNNLVKVGGQSSAGFEVIAPYVNRTKTEMVKQAYSKGYILDSFSCYFPTKSGESCGKCGSCLLKKNALARAIDHHE